MSKYTPGPWEAGSSAIWGPLGKIIAQCPPQAREAEWKANAALISQAPETAAERDRLKSDLKISEDCADIVRGHARNLMKEIKTLKAEKAELVEALRRTECALTWYVEDEGECDIEALEHARALLAKIDGGQ